MAWGALLVVLLALLPTARGDDDVVWSQAVDQGRVAVYSNDSYVVEVPRGYPVLHSAPFMVHVGGAWYNTSSLKRLGARNVSGTHKRLGRWTGYAIYYSAGGTPVTISFKYYNSSFIEFEQAFPEGAAATNLSSTASLSGTKGLPNPINVLSAFPCFVDTVGQTLLSWGGEFFMYGIYPNLTSAAQGSRGGPVVLWDTVRKFGRVAAVWGVSSQFKSTIIGHPPGGGAACAGIQEYVTSLPKGFTTSTRIEIGDTVTGVMHSYGAGLLRTAGVDRRVESASTTKLSYWTDNGAFYDWYSWRNVTALGTPESILVELSDQFKRDDIPVQYWQLDAYWYPFIRADANCKIVDQAVPQYFPSGLQALSDRIGKFLLYSGPTCGNSSYWKKNGGKWPSVDSFEYNVGWALGQLGNVHPDYSEAFYDTIFAESIATQGMMGFEVDFLDFNYLIFPYFLSNVTASEIFLTGMARAAERHGMDVQYCMALPSDILFSTTVPSVTHARASPDYWPGAWTWKIGMNSLLASSMGIRPSKDNFWTACNESAGPRTGCEDNPELVAIAATLSMGPLGFSDQVGRTNYSVIRPSFAADGTLLHPSRPATPLDLVFATAPPGELTHAHSEVSGMLWYSVLLAESNKPNVTVTKEDLWPSPPEGGYWGAQYPNRCVDGMAAESCLVPFGTQGAALDAAYQPGKSEFGFWTLSPEHGNGMVLLGEVEKYVRVSPNRFSSVTVLDTSLTVVVKGRAGESVRVGYLTPTKTVKFASGVVGPEGWTTLFLS